MLGLLELLGLLGLLAKGLMARAPAPDETCGRVETCGCFSIHVNLHCSEKGLEISATATVPTSALSQGWTSVLSVISPAGRSASRMLTLLLASSVKSTAAFLLTASW